MSPPFSTRAFFSTSPLHLISVLSLCVSRCVRCYYYYCYHHFCHSRHCHHHDIFPVWIGIYLAESEQKSCALAAATTMNGILCTSAGGYLIEQLPGVEEDTIKKVERNLGNLVAKDGGNKLPTNLLLSGMAPLDIAEIILEDLDMKPLQQLKPTLKCDCTEDRLFRALRLLPREEVDQIIKEQDKIEARCHFCGKVYRMGPDEVMKRFAKAKGDPTKDDEVDL